MPKAANGVDRRTFQRWVDENPLRRWRSRTETTVMQAAGQLGVSMTMVQLWERGVHMPAGEKMERLERLCGRNTARLWAAWWNERPQAE